MSVLNNLPKNNQARALRKMKDEQMQFKKLRPCEI
jgi:hypothetical protein